MSVGSTSKHGRKGQEIGITNYLQSTNESIRYQCVKESIVMVIDQWTGSNAISVLGIRSYWRPIMNARGIPAGPKVML